MCFKDSIIGEFLLTGRRWDPELPQLLRDAYGRFQGRVIVEVGSNIGASFVPISADYPDCRFLMFEPVPCFYDLLTKNLHNYGAKNVHARQMAISNKTDDIIEVACGRANAGAWAIREPVLETVKLSTQTLDDLLKNEDVFFLKIDVDGYEQKVIEGAAKTLSRCHPDLFMEFDSHLMHAMGINPFQLLEMVTQHGYREFLIFSNTGDLLKATNSAAEVVRYAEQAPCYVDILIRSV
ncbi:MAG: hypothetical protein A2X46_16510 [Lentisphaerae bacterium GWF2_57_35]|nr:MAG: hypothetical protein A2X46_16510 [Lentisphaerae bacterium GWF2_57_35]